MKTTENNKAIWKTNKRAFGLLLIAATILPAGYFSITTFLLHTRPQAPKFNFSKNDCTVIEVLDAVQSQMGVYHVNAYCLLESARNVSVSFKDAPLENVLETCSRDQFFTFEMFQDASGIIIVRPRMMNYSAVIIDDTGESVPNASIFIEDELRSKGKGNGEFNLVNVFENAKIKITADGMEDKEIYLGGSRNSVIKLKRKPQLLNRKSVADLSAVTQRHQG